MISKSKVQIGSTPPLFSGENIGALGQPSKPLVSSDTTVISMEILNNPSPTTFPAERREIEISEKSRQHSVLLKVLLSSLEKAGLLKRFKVLSKEGEWMETQVVFDNSIWEENLDLKSVVDRRGP